MKHTPGPWRIEDIESTQPYTEYDVYADDHRVMHVHGIDDGAEANARLIAAAPDLLLTLKDLIGWIDISGLAKTKDGGCGPFAYKGTEYEVVSNARAAIAKAEGGV